MYKKSGHFWIENEGQSFDGRASLQLDRAGGPLGLDGFGAIWKARDTQLDHIVAIKIPHSGLLTEKEQLERFQREARAAAHLRNPNIVSVLEVDTLNGLQVEEVFFSC